MDVTKELVCIHFWFGVGNV